MPQAGSQTVSSGPPSRYCSGVPEPTKAPVDRLRMSGARETLIRGGAKGAGKRPEVADELISPNKRLLTPNIPKENWPAFESLNLFGNIGPSFQIVVGIARERSACFCFLAI